MEDSIMGFGVYCLIGITVLGMIYAEGWNILFYTVMFVLSIRILIMKTKRELNSF